MNKYENIINELINKDYLNEEDSFYYSRQCSDLFYSDDETENGIARRILINALDNWRKIPKIHEAIWIDLLEAAGFYPYIARDKDKSNLLNSTPQLIRKEYHASRNIPEIYYHEEQKILSELLSKGKNVLISAPTSFGKSLLIEDIVASNKFKNIVIIQPSLALLDETRKKLIKYKDKYRIIVRTSQEPSSEKGNLFLLTAERVMEYINLPKIDFFIIDEFYKLSAKRDDERSDVLNNAFYKLLKHKAQYYLLSPIIDGISPGFEDKYDAVFEKSSYSLVDNIVINVYSEHDEFKHPRKYKKYRENVLFEQLFNLKHEQTIIYCSSPERVRKISNKFKQYLVEMGEKGEKEFSIIEWISKNISDKWSVIDCLKYGIGIHDAALPKHMSSTIITYFNDKKLNYLFCTSTIIEGVNTSAKNVIYYDSTKGNRKRLDCFDYENIKGRSGRLMIHYVGRMYNFKEPPEKQKIIIDIPFYEQKSIPEEILIHIDDSDIKNKNSIEYMNIMSIPEPERKIIRENGLLVKGQQKIIEILKNDYYSKRNLICWTGLANYEQLSYILSLAWDNLLKEGESTSPFTKEQIIYITNQYVYNQSISILIENQRVYFRNLEIFQSLTDEEIFDEAIRFSFQAMRHWFSYRVPKMILTIDKLQKYVSGLYGMQSGDYVYYASQIENDFIRPNLILLSEYGVPRTAIRKLEDKISPDMDENQVINEVGNIVNKFRKEFIDYEVEKISECIK